MLWKFGIIRSAVPFFGNFCRILLLFQVQFKKIFHIFPKISLNFLGNLSMIDLRISSKFFEYFFAFFQVSQNLFHDIFGNPSRVFFKNFFYIFWMFRLNFSGVRSGFSPESVQNSLGISFSIFVRTTPQILWEFRRHPFGNSSRIFFFVNSSRFFFIFF